jgi:glycosyltransferase involved in cell wall biosynthesis
LVCPTPDHERGDAESALGEAFSDIHIVRREGWTPALAGWLEGTLAHRLPFAPGLDMAAARRLAASVSRAFRSADFDVVHVRQLPMAPYVDRWVRRGRLLELVDSETLGAERALPRTARKRLRAKVAASIERRAMLRYDIVTTVAEADAERLRTLAPGHPVAVVPNGVEADRFRRDPAVAERGGRVIFVGAMSYPPNVAAVRHFCESILPRIRSSEPSVEFQVVGRNPSSSVLALGDRPGVRVTGEVDDVRPYLNEAALVVSPMVSGSGIKNKVLEAFSMERAVVSTSLGVEGLPVRSGHHAVVADDPDEFAAAVVRLLRQPEERERMGQRARRLVEDRYTWEACASRYDDLYTELAHLTRERSGR